MTGEKINLLATFCNANMVNHLGIGSRSLTQTFIAIDRLEW